MSLERRATILEDKTTMAIELSEKGRDKIQRTIMVKALELQREIITRTPVDRGRLRASIEVERIDKGARVFTNVAYAKFVEVGTMPFTPPLEPLKEWGRRIGNEEIGVAVWNKIRNQGIRPQPFFKPGIDAFKLQNQ